MKDATILPVEDQARDEASMLRALNQNQMRKEIFVSRDEISALDSLPGRNMQSLLET